MNKSSSIFRSDVSFVFDFWLLLEIQGLSQRYGSFSPATMNLLPPAQEIHGQDLRPCIHTAHSIVKHHDTLNTQRQSDYWGMSHRFSGCCHTYCASTNIGFRFRMPAQCTASPPPNLGSSRIQCKSGHRSTTWSCTAFSQQLGIQLRGGYPAVCVLAPNIQDRRWVSHDVEPILSGRGDVGEPLVSHCTALVRG